MTNEKIIKITGIAVGVSALLLLARHIIKKRKEKRESKLFTKETKTVTAGASVQGKAIAPITINIREKAKIIADSLGTSGAGRLNPINWFEDEGKAVATIKSVPKNYIGGLIEQYYDQTKNDLQSDLQNYLSDSEYLSIRDKFI